MVTVLTLLYPATMHSSCDSLMQGVAALEHQEARAGGAPHDVAVRLPHAYAERAERVRAIEHRAGEDPAAARLQRAASRALPLQRRGV